MLQCYVGVVDDESDETKSYIQEYGDAALTDYYAYYGCPSGRFLDFSEHGRYLRVFLTEVIFKKDTEASKIHKQR